MSTMVVSYNLACIADEVESTDIIILKILMFVIDTTVDNCNDHIRISCCVIFPNRKNIDICSCYMALIEGTCIVIMPLLSELRIVKGIHSLDRSHRLNDFNTRKRCKIISSLSRRNILIICDLIPFVKACSTSLLLELSAMREKTSHCLDTDCLCKSVKIG